MTLKHRLITLLRNQIVWRTCLTISVIAILFLATTSQDYPIPSAPNDKVNHFIAFLELTLLARLSWPHLPLTTIALSVLGFGMLIEILQAPLPYRDFSLADLAADGVAIAAGMIPWPGLRYLQALDHSTTTAE